ncbi:MORC family CW-type zinc finger protein 3-like [Chanos chanos]|uniref:MORC family CW-type zinc finger protein 3-like n=1 Tax=Chanos chanos TaxID=29144 RepID=A0A6J2USV6_CHACN|nr:MORC family CW-type zinc finger protein 3-like [Chanos chanos]
MAAQTNGNIPASKVSPKYLHANSTSHTWAFGAIAELIDNAYDPDVRAKNFWIDKKVIKEKICLTFRDNGVGMDYEKMYKMLSFGFSEKEEIDGHAPVGRYGNGFKSGSMRLGKDAIVFSKTKETMCVGLLSQTYLEEIGAENIIVPIVTFTDSGKNQIQASPEHADCLRDILKHSLFQNVEELRKQFQAISTRSQTYEKTGTYIIIWNLRKTSERPTEFDFDENRFDIRIPADQHENKKKTFTKPERVLQSVPESDYSLRAYCSILYMKPRMQINIRGKRVDTQLISKSLAFTRRYFYSPSCRPSKRVPINFGFNTKSKEHYGLMIYNNNRLIISYKRIGCQLMPSDEGVGVIGVIECDFLTPTHNKQDFDNTVDYRRTIRNLETKLKEYWKKVCAENNSGDPNSSGPVEDMMERPDQIWKQCSDCLKWRKLPDNTNPDRVPEEWSCSMNPNKQFSSCDVPEEQEDSGDEEQTHLKHPKKKAGHKATLRKTGVKRAKQSEFGDESDSEKPPTFTSMPINSENDDDDDDVVEVGQTQCDDSMMDTKQERRSLRKRRGRKVLENDDDDDDDVVEVEQTQCDDSMMDTNQERRRAKRFLTSPKENKGVKRSKGSDGGHADISETPPTFSSMPELHITSVSLSTVNYGEGEQNGCDSSLNEGQKEQGGSEDGLRERQEEQSGGEDSLQQGQKEQNECDDIPKEVHKEQSEYDDILRKKQEEQTTYCRELEKLLSLGQSSLLRMQQQQELLKLLKTTIQERDDLQKLLKATRQDRDDLQKKLTMLLTTTCQERDSLHKQLKTTCQERDDLQKQINTLKQQIEQLQSRNMKETCDSNTQMQRTETY